MNKINKIKARKDVFVLNFSIFLIFLSQFAQEPCQKLEFEQAKNVTYRFEALDELIIFDFHRHFPNCLFKGGGLQSSQKMT